MDIKIGQTVESKEGKQGIVRYIGSPEAAPAGIWVGIELPDQSGKNDGSLKGERCFTCAPGHGLFIRKDAVAKIVKQAAAAPRTNSAATTNGGAVRPRPSAVGIGADAARKRQSLMSTGSSTAGSRLSVRSPTRSPTKAMSSASSTASTPRTATPATTARTSDSSTKSRLSTTGRTSMAPPPAPRKTTPATRQSISGGIGRGAASAGTRPASATRPPLAGSRLSLQPKPTTRPTQPARSPSPDHDSHPHSPTIDEDEENDPEPNQSIDQILTQPPPVEDVPPPPPEPAPSETARSRTTSISRANITAETRAADKKELEQLRARLRTLEKNAADDQEKLKKVDGLQNDKSRYETIIQTLQKKLKTTQTTMAELRTQLEEAVQKASEAPPPPDGELESVLELAKLDKEMAEERAEMAEIESRAFASKNEELEIEVDLLREEVKELTSTMSPEERSNAGWLQKEREIDRLRHALGLLRDHSQETEEEMKDQIKELQETLDETSKKALQHDEISQKLAQMEETNRHLKEQLEDAETNDEVVVAMEAQREEAAATIEQLKKQISDLEEHIQVTDELEKFHIDEERQLHYDLDESEAQLSDRQRQVLEQEKVIEDLEFTLSKFREVVSGLQSDVDELRRSRDVNETQANEMTAKSRAMMDLNMQLQNSAVKTQLKTIDFETRDMQAEQARTHLEIVQLFIPDSFDQDRNPVMALLALKRTRSKALLVKTILAERMRDRPHLAQDDPFSVFEIMEKMDRIAAHCERLINFVSTCTMEAFSKFSGAVYELEPVERSISSWVESLRRDELADVSAETLQRMIGILIDMSEKLIEESNESKAAELVSQASLTERYADIAALQLNTLLKAVQSRLGEPKEDDEEALSFDKKLDAAAMKTRTVKYLASKLTAALADLRNNSMCLGETSWIYFEDTVRSAEQLSAMIRRAGKAVIDELSCLEHEETPTYASAADTLTHAASEYLLELDKKPSSSEDIFAIFTHELSSLQSQIDDLSHKAADLSSAVEFEASPTAPWVARAKALKAQKVISQDTAEELQRLKARSDSQLRDLADKNKEAEELRIRVEVLESRQRESKAKDGEVKTLKEELERLATERGGLAGELERTKKEMEDALAKSEKEREELQALKTAAVAEGGNAATRVVSALGDNAEKGSVLRAELDSLKAECLSLEAAIRHLRAENASLRLPVGEVALKAGTHAWLSADNLKPNRAVVAGRAMRKEMARREGREVLEGLIDLAKNARTVRLRASVVPESDGGDNRVTVVGRGKMESSTRWQVAVQREEVERWKGDVEEAVRRGRMELRARPATVKGRSGIGKGMYALPDLPETGMGKVSGVEGNGVVEVGKVKIVGEEGVASELLKR